MLIQRKGHADALRSYVFIRVGTYGAVPTGIMASVITGVIMDKTRSIVRRIIMTFRKQWEPDRTGSIGSINYCVHFRLHELQLLETSKGPAAYIPPGANTRCRVFGRRIVLSMHKRHT